MDEGNAFSMDCRSSDLGHHDFGSDGRKAIEKDGLLRVAGNDVVLQVVHIAGGVGMFAVAWLEVTVTEIDPGVAGGPARLMTVSAVVVQRGQRPFFQRTRFSPDSDCRKIVWNIL